MALLKLFLMAFSFVFWAAGLTMLTIGIWAKISLGTYLVLSTNEYPNTPFILLATGTAVIVWGFLGCFSAATEHRCLLRTYGGFQLVVLVAGLAAGLSSLFYHKDIAEGFQNGLREAIHSYTEDEEKAEALDSIQRTLDCCGVESYRDWFSSPWSMRQQTPNNSVPASCCRARKGCLHSPLPSNAWGIYRDGCFSKVYNFVSNNMFYIATAALGLALLQVVGIVLACLLAVRILPHAGPPGGAIPH
ncbi:tetraspanin-7-like [Hemicordylus capensis]|uniref:tetraspanin-7-like n=1 Tax=Hemicordylus capensis TaxID=884348 RepID=UPI0023033EE1|nr:tetraspanin-7-like [Hemicordylus capensis]